MATVRLHIADLEIVNKKRRKELDDIRPCMIPAIHDGINVAAEI